jgi:hypothetical protein
MAWGLGQRKARDPGGFAGCRGVIPGAAACRIFGLRPPGQVMDFRLPASAPDLRDAKAPLDALG